MEFSSAASQLWGDETTQPMLGLSALHSSEHISEMAFLFSNPGSRTFQEFLRKTLYLEQYGPVVMLVPGGGSSRACMPDALRTSMADGSTMAMAMEQPKSCREVRRASGRMMKDQRSLNG